MNFSSHSFLFKGFGMWLVSAWPVGGNLPFELIPGEFTLGRGTDQNIVICDSSISRLHARIRVTDPADVTIEDLGSRNGIEINGQLTASGVIRLHDRIRLGAIPCLIAEEPLPQSFTPEEPEDSTVPRSQLRRKDRLRLDGALTPSQRYVLRLLAKGLSEEEVAAQSGRSYHTVHNHVRVIYKLFGVHSRAELLSKINKGS